MTREIYSMIDCRATVKKPRGEIVDDLATWPNSKSFTTAPLPIADLETGASSTMVPLVFEVTNRLTASERTYTSSLRFTGPNGVRLGHFRAATNLATSAQRIFVGGMFEVGKPITITYYWGKTGQTQPGVGFPTAAQVLSDFRLFLLFENNAPKDFSATPATFTTVGTPTYVTGLNGQALSCGPGNNIQTTASKLRSDARTQRHAMALIFTPTENSTGRTICWANWTSNQRAFQLFSDMNYVELYVDEDGVSPYQKWTNTAPFQSGWTWIGGSWVGGSDTALVQRDGVVLEGLRGFPETPTQATLFNSSSPYIIGGTPVTNIYHAGYVEAVLELLTPLSKDQMAAYHFAWKENDTFLSFDRTPNAFSFPMLSSQETSTEVVFAKVQISGMSDGTKISVSGNGNPSFAISSSSTANDDVTAKGTSQTTINAGQWVRVWHTTAAGNSQTQISSLTIGSVTVEFQSSTKAAAGTGGGSGIPTGPATYTVTSLADLHNVFNNQLQGGQILEIVAGDYRNQGKLVLRNKNFGSGASAVVRASVRAYRGFLPAEGGLFIEHDGAWNSGSGGAEFSSAEINGVSNLVLDGIRIYAGEKSLADNRFYTVDVLSCSNITFQYCKFCGNKIDPYSNDSILRLSYTPTNPWYLQGRGINIARSCDRISFKKSIFHYFGFCLIGFFSCTNGLVEDCLMMDAGGDHIRCDGPQDNFIVRRSIFYRTFVQPNADGTAWHVDNSQNTSKTQANCVNHTYDHCIIAPGDGNTAHVQGTFYEADNWPAYAAPNGLKIVDSLIESRVLNTIYCRPGNKLEVLRTTIIQNQWGGWHEYRNAQDQIVVRRGDPLIWTPTITVASTTGGAYSFGTNKLTDSIYYAHDFNTGAGDTVTNSTQLTSSGYATHLVDYPLYSGGGTFRPCKIINDYGVLVPSELMRMSPKTSSSLHPNNRGGADFGGSKVLELYDALAT